MKLLFVSTHTDQMTGYSKVATAILQQLQTVPNLDIFHFGFQRHPTHRRPKLEKITQYDAWANEDPKEQGFGFNCFQSYLKLVNPDVIFIYNDTHIINQFLELIPETHHAKIYIYLDQVYHGTALFNIPKRADKIFVFSNSWKFKLPDDSKATLHVLQHAPSSAEIDKELIDKFKTEHNLHDKEIFLNINRNSPRKRLDLTIQAFKLYHEKHPNSHLLLVTSSSGHYNIPLICSLEQIQPNTISFIDTDKSRLTDEQINLLYNVADYGLNTADGEGFGLSTVEHANVHKPQLTLKLGAFPDFLKEEENVLITPTIKNYIQLTGIGLFSQTTTAENIAEHMEQLKTKSPPSITLTWESVTEELKSFLGLGDQPHGPEPTQSIDLQVSAC